MEDRIGNFEVGKEFDALVINLEAPGSEVDVFDEDTLEDCIQKFIYLGKPNNICFVCLTFNEWTEFVNVLCHISLSMLITLPRGYEKCPFGFLFSFIHNVLSLSWD